MGSVRARDPHHRGGRASTAAAWAAVVFELPEQGGTGEVARARHRRAPPCPGPPRHPRGPGGPGGLRLRSHRDVARTAHPARRDRQGRGDRALRGGERHQRLPSLRPGARSLGEASTGNKVAFARRHRLLTPVRRIHGREVTDMEQRAPAPGPSSVPPPPLSEPPPPPQPPSRWYRFKRVLLGGPKDFQDPQLFHTLSLAAFLAWVGLGADGLSSSSYGPEEAFKALGEHQYLAIFLAALTALTVLIIAASYSKIIEHFPFGGGGYVVASRLLGPRWGVVSGSALLVDYVLTITTSIAAGGDALFSSLPESLHFLKLPTDVAVIAALTVLNLRGVKESVTTLVPIFLTFVLTHAVVIVGGVFFHLGRASEVVEHVRTGLNHDLGTLGTF